jgi:hypothetical protein
MQDSTNAAVNIPTGMTRDEIAHALNEGWRVWNLAVTGAFDRGTR